MSNIIETVETNSDAILEQYKYDKDQSIPEVFLKLSQSGSGCGLFGCFPQNG